MSGDVDKEKESKMNAAAYLRRRMWEGRCLEHRREASLLYSRFNGESVSQISSGAFSLVPHLSRIWIRTKKSLVLAPPVSMGQGVPSFRLLHRHHLGYRRQGRGTDARLLAIAEPGLSLRFSGKTALRIYGF